MTEKTYHGGRLENFYGTIHARRLLAGLEPAIAKGGKIYYCDTKSEYPAAPKKTD